MIKLDLRRVVATSSKSNGKYVRFSTNGQVAISSDAVKELGIEEDDKAVFFQNRANPTEWFFSFGKEGDYVLREYKSQSETDRTRGFSSSGLRDQVLHSLDLPKKTIRLYLSKEPVELEGKKLWMLNYRK